ncbi:MAG: ABC transporter six-transmembrane domain-containing protein [Pyrinomonadaceae bacterium]|nr:ABC transporter six-transmembrane domain-containing protein [Pyrinomonadaceae bacterium]
MQQQSSILLTIWKNNKFSIGSIYLLNLTEEILYLLIPSSVGLLIDTFINNQGYGIYAFAFTYIGWQGIATYRKIQDTVVFTKVFNQISLQIIKDHQSKNIDTTTINARVELMKQVTDFFENDLPFLVRSIISIFGSAILLYFYNSKLFLAALIIILPSILINYFYSKKIVETTEKVNNQFERQVDVIEKGSFAEQEEYFTQLRQFNIRKSSLEAYNFGLLEIFVFFMILVSIYIICKTESMNYGSIVASYGIIIKFAYSFDFIPHTTTKIATLKDITNRINKTLKTS